MKKDPNKKTTTSLRYLSFAWRGFLLGVILGLVITLIRVVPALFNDWTSGEAGGEQHPWFFLPLVIAFMTIRTAVITALIGAMLGILTAWITPRYMTKKLLLKRVAYVMVPLLVLDLATYAILDADKAMVQTARERLPRSHRQFACISQETWDALSAHQQETAQAILKQEFGTVYIGRDNIPPEKWYYDPDRPNVPMGLHGGCIIDWRFRKGILCFSGSYSYYEGNLSGYASSATYIWLFGKWVRVRKAHPMVS